MGSSYVSGFRTALQRWPLPLLLFAASSVPGLAFGAVAWSWLATALDKSLATRTLLTDLDMNVFVDLIAHHGEGLWMLLAGGTLLAIVCWLVGVGLNAMVIAAVGDDAPLATAAHRALELYGRFLRLDLLALAVDALLLIATVAVVRWLTRWMAETPSEITVYLIIGASAFVAAVLLMFFTAVHDHARIHSAATGTGAAGAYAWAVAFVATGERRALPLVLLLLASGGAGWLAYQAFGMLIVTSGTLGVFLSILWGELLIVYRMFLRVWSFAAQTELQNLSQATSA
jgi:hypothetical protein